MIVFDEKQYAEEILANRHDGKNTTQKQFNILAKYYSYSGYTDEEIVDLLIQFGNDKEGSFNEVINERKLLNAIKATRYPLRVGRTVELTAKEIDKLLEIEDINVRKVLFVILVVAKYFMSGGFVAYRGELTDLFKLAKLSHLPKQKKQSIIYTLGTLGLIDVDFRYGYYHILFYDPEDKDICLTIDKFDDILNFLPFVCESCGKILFGKPKRRLICDDCYDKKRTRDNREKVKRFRAKRTDVTR